MNPPSNQHAVTVGLFVVVGLVILGGGILTIGDLNDTFTNKITVSALFDEVGGLKQGDNIWFSGVKVGRVTKVGFQGPSKVEVVMKVDRDTTAYIHQDALVKIGSDGLIGNRIVVLYGGTPSAPTLQDGDVLALGDAISTEEVMTMLQENNTNLLAITTDLKEVSGKLARGEGTFGRLLVDDALYTGLMDTSATLNTASANARNLTASLSVFAANLNREGGLPNDLVTDRTTYASLTDTVGQLQHAGERASDLMEGLAVGVADPNTPVGTLMRDEQAGTDLKGTLENLNHGSLLLAEDLEALQHNILLRCFFRKKERAEARAREQAEAGGTEVLLSPAP